jgi:hypothetical protein
MRGVTARSGLPRIAASTGQQRRSEVARLFPHAILQLGQIELSRSSDGTGFAACRGRAG